MEVLFVCRNNAGRSQCAEAFFNGFSKKHKAASAGTEVKKTDLAGFPPGILITKIMKSNHRIDISKNRRKQVTIKMLREADRIIVMMEKSEAKKYLPGYFKGFSKKMVYWRVRDMALGKNIDMGSKARTIGRIKKEVKKLVKETD